MPPHISEFFYRPKGHARDKKYSFKTYAEFERHPDFDTPEKRFRYQTSRRTLLSPVAIATSLSQWHVVGDTKGYAGAQMPYSIWLNNTGYAFHAGTRPHTCHRCRGLHQGVFDFEKTVPEDCSIWFVVWGQITPTFFGWVTKPVMEICVIQTKQ